MKPSYLVECFCWLPFFEHLHDCFVFFLSGFCQSSDPRLSLLCLSFRMCFYIWEEHVVGIIKKCFAVGWWKHVDQCWAIKDFDINARSLRRTGMASFQNAIYYSRLYLCWAKFPFSDSVGGKPRFLRAKNCFRFPSRDWHAMNNLENRATLFLRSLVLHLSLLFVDFSFWWRHKYWSWK